MNFLAHIYLSGQTDQMKIGNFIGDYVKGRKYRNYPEYIKKGILLHRKIDSFTDNSPIPQRLKSLLKPYYRRYSGIVIDLFYDHFLANNWGYFSDVPLEDFISRFYDLLYKYFDYLPERVQNFVPHMIQHNRILSYRDIQGLYHALKVMVRTTSLPDKTDEGIVVLNEHYNTFNENFLEFFPTLIKHVKEQFQIDLQYSFNSQL
jgi:acyl carrier protein phosphodiesterase